MLVLGHLQNAADQKQLTGQGFVNNYRLFLLAAAPRSQTALSWRCVKPKQMRHFLWSEICRMFNFCILVYFLRGSQHCGFQKVFPHLWQQIPFISACFLLLFLGCGTTGIGMSHPFQWWYNSYKSGLQEPHVLVWASATIRELQFSSPVTSLTSACHLVEEEKALAGISCLVLVHEASRCVVCVLLAEEQFPCILLARHSCLELDIA